MPLIFDSLDKTDFLSSFFLNVLSPLSPVSFPFCWNSFRDETKDTNSDENQSAVSFLLSHYSLFFVRVSVTKEILLWMKTNICIFLFFFQFSFFLSFVSESFLPKGRYFLILFYFNILLLLFLLTVFLSKEHYFGRK